MKQELAVKLFPSSISTESAMQLLRREIRRSPKLRERLFENKGSAQLHYFTHRQLEILLEHFCITEEEFEKL